MRNSFFVKACAPPLDHRASNARALLPAALLTGRVTVVFRFHSLRAAAVGFSSDGRR